MDDIRYLFVHKDHPLEVQGTNSGAEMATRCLAKALVQLGKKVIVAAQLRGNEQVHQGVEYWDLGPDFNVTQALERARALGPYYLISAGRAQPILESRSDPKCRGRFLISHDRSGNDSGIKPEILCRVADKVICVSDAQKEVFLRAGAPSEKLITLYNGVELDLFQAGQPENRNYKRLIFVGALVEDKGIHWLVQSFSELKGQFPEISLDVYGSSDLWGRSKLFDEKEIERQVPGLKFHGKVSQSEIAKAFREAGCCVIPSIWFDPFPLTALEAQACGCPVVAFDVGGLKEGILDGETGIVMEDVNPQVLTNTLRQILQAPQSLRQMSEAALAKARPRFTWEKVAKEVIAICESSVIARSGTTKQPLTQTSQQSGHLKVKKKLGFLTTWNQECGLATYARFLLTPFEVGSYVVLAEKTSAIRTRADETYVERCWTSNSDNFQELAQSITRNDIGLLHINCQHRFFPQPQFSKFLQTVKQSGVKVVAHVHSLFTVDASLSALIQASDKVIVHSPECKLEAIANGASGDKVEVIPHGVEVRKDISASERSELRKTLGMPATAKIVVSFGFIQPHKGIEGLIEGIVHLRRKGVDAYGYIAGKPMPEDPRSQQYAEILQQLAKEQGVGEYIQFLNRFIGDSEVGSYLQASDVVLMNYQSQYYEASGACSLAVGAGAVVAASIAPPFASFGDAVWHITAGYPTPLALDVLLTNDQARRCVQASAQRYAEQNSWSKVKERLFETYRTLDFEPVVITKEKVVESNRQTQGLRVLIQNRPNTWTQAGGDSVVIDKLVSGLRAKGVQVQVDVEGRANPAEYDVVHLFNFALPDLTRRFGERAQQANVPFIVTTLNEDISKFHNQSIAVANSLIDYVRIGQNKDWYRKNTVDIRKVEPSGSFDNRWTAENAAALLGNGSVECEALRRDYPNAKRVEEVKLGFDNSAQAGPELFWKEYNLRDFVLCVGRIESRKNQLMLLKALESSEIPVVLAGGGFTYQPEYEKSVRAFQRKGKTLVLGRLSPEMLASAYAAAKIHVLPSWYELPGLVSLEAAHFGKNIVVTPYGTASDYFGDKAFYCEPSCPNSIYNAILAAYYAPVVSGISETVRQYSWSSMVEQTLQIYQSVQKNRSTTIAVASQFTFATPTYSQAIPTGDQPRVTEVIASDFQVTLEKGENAAKEGLFKDAHELLAKAESLDGRSARAIRARGTVYLAEGNHKVAKGYFERVIAIDAGDAKALCGLGMCELADQRTEQGYHRFLEALRNDPNQITAIHQLVRCSYTLNRFGDLENVLRRYTSEHPSDEEMEFCLAGCVYKVGRVAEAEAMLTKLLSRNPLNQNAKELQAHIAKEKTAAVVAPTVNVAQTVVPPTFASFQSQPEPVIAPKPVMPAVQQSAPTFVVPTMSTPTKPEVIPSSFNNFDSEIQKLEDAKRGKKFAEVKQGSESLLKTAGLRDDQRERINLIKAESMVLDNEVDGALNIILEVLVKNPRSARATCGKGAIFAHRNDWTEAKRLFEQALQYQPGYDVALAGLGVWALQQGQREQAWDYYQSALKSNPENMRAIMGVIETGYPLRRFAQIEQALRTYLEMHPCDLEFVYSLAGCLFAQNRLDEARAEVERIILFKPSDQRALELQRMIRERAGGVQIASGA